MERPKRPYSIQKRPTVKHRHIYYAKFRNEAGRYTTAVSTGCTRMDDAIHWADQRLRQAADKQDNITLSDYARGFWEPAAPFATDRAAHIIPAWGSERLADISARRPDEWVVEMHCKRDMAPATINKILQTLRAILEHAVLTLKEAMKLLTGPGPWGDFRHYAINVLAATTGLRMCELRALRVEDVREDRVAIRRSWEQGYVPRAP